MSSAELVARGLVRSNTALPRRLAGGDLAAREAEARCRRGRRLLSSQGRV